VIPDARTASVPAAPPALSVWIVAAAPLLLLAALIGFVVWSGPADALRDGAYPPVERLAFQHITLADGVITAAVLNDGPDPVTIAQVAVDDAFWTFTASNGQHLGRLGRTTLTIPYPWVHGETHTLRVVTATGVTFDHTIAVAVPTPKPNAHGLLVFALIGLYVGVLPVTIGLLWFPLVSRLGRAGIDFVLALTVGLLLFLLVDAAHEASGIAAGLPESYQGVALLAFAAAAAYLGLEAVGRWLRGRRRAALGQGWALALLIAIGIGLHNLGEGLAIGAAFGLGEAALGSLLIVGFTLHNTTEGLAIVAPLAREHRTGARVPIGSLLQLGLIGGVPTIAGAWLGGFTYSPVWSVLFLAFGVGAIAQVSVQILRQVAGERGMLDSLSKGPIVAGLAAGFAIMYVTGMLVG
jgi:zinc transporter, ZIP family